jgi:hypothetical protein
MLYFHTFYNACQLRHWHLFHLQKDSPLIAQKQIQIKSWLMARLCDKERASCFLSKALAFCELNARMAMTW